MITTLARTAAVLVLISQGFLLAAVFRPSGETAMGFAFVGHASVGLGIALALVAATLRIRAERGHRPAVDGDDDGDEGAAAS